MYKVIYVGALVLFALSGCALSGDRPVFDDVKKTERASTESAATSSVLSAEKGVQDKDLREGWQIKKGNVYFGERLEKEFDPSSFVVINRKIVKDKNKVYLCFEGACNPIDRDPETFAAVDGSQFEKDKNGVYQGNDKIDGADGKTFEKILDKFGSFYFRDKNAVYYLWTKVPGANPDKFEIVGFNFGRDDKHYFRENKILESVDYKTFELFKGGFYAKDKRNIYNCRDGCSPILGVDYETFRVIYPSVAEDKNKGYLGDNSMPKDSDEYRLALLRSDPANCYADPYQKADKSSYVEKGGGFGIDKNCLYFHGNVISGSHAASLEMLADGYVKDRNRAYYAKPEDVVVGRTDDVDPSSFRVLGGGYARDKSRLYYKMQLTNASDNDLDSFKLIDPKSNRWGFDGEDKSVYYKNGQATFKFLLIQ